MAMNALPSRVTALIIKAREKQEPVPAKVPYVRNTLRSCFGQQTIPKERIETHMNLRRPKELRSREGYYRVRQVCADGHSQACLDCTVDTICVYRVPEHGPKIELFLRNLLKYHS